MYIPESDSSSESATTVRALGIGLAGTGRGVSDLTVAAAVGDAAGGATAFVMLVMPFAPVDTIATADDDEDADPLIADADGTGVLLDPETSAAAIL